MGAVMYSGPLPRMRRSETLRLDLEDSLTTICEQQLATSYQQFNFLLRRAARRFRLHGLETAEMQLFVLRLEHPYKNIRYVVLETSDR